MSKLLVIFIILFIAGCKNSGNKYYTGIVEYTYTYSSDSLNIDSLTAIRPSKSILRYDTLNYQSEFIATDTIIYYYSGLYNICLSATKHRDNYECEDYSAFTDSVISYRLYDTDEKILGYPCKILEVQKKNSWLQYYVSNELKISPGTYRKHVSYNWDFYGEKTNGGLILRSEHRFKSFTMHGIATAVNIKPGNFKALEIDEKLFSQFASSTCFLPETVLNER